MHTMEMGAEMVHKVDEQTEAKEAELQKLHRRDGTDLKAIADRIWLSRINALRGNHCCFSLTLYMHESIDTENALRSVPPEAAQITAFVQRMQRSAEDGEMYGFADDCRRLLTMLSALSPQRQKHEETALALLREFIKDDGIANYDSTLCWGCGYVKNAGHSEKCLIGRAEALLGP